MSFFCHASIIQKPPRKCTRRFEITLVSNCGGCGFYWCCRRRNSGWISYYHSLAWLMFSAALFTHPDLGSVSHIHLLADFAL